MDGPKLNFIVGIGRSGTTLLMSMLNSHPALQATPEVNFFNFFYSSWKKKSDFTENDFSKVEAFMDMFKNRKQTSGFSWDMDKFKGSIGKAPTINFETIYSCFYQSFVYGNVQKHITHNFDKNPINTLYLRDIMDLFPQSKFIYLVRDPRANYLSRKEKIKKRKANIFFNTQRWRMYNEAALNVVAFDKERVLILKYEDLVSDPVLHLKKLAVFCGFDYNDGMLNFHLNVMENSLKKVDEKSLGSHPQVKDKYEKLSKPVNRDRLDVWKEKLSKNEIDICSDICRIAEKFNYDMKHDKPSYNILSFYKGLILAKIGIAKDKVMYKLPLFIKLKLIKTI